ncbi:MAG: ATP-binding protein [Dehalococcoidia bacterium]|nr:MAG: ATP-binding protein [Dehalococcoidia bacterium]TRZ47801.1 MAG: ATP-binding protein [Dehalococcoidia bacterium]
MKNEQKNKIIGFLNDQITQAEFRSRAYVFDENSKRRPERNIYKKINKYIDNFLSGEGGVRWITLAGLRGAGKTTIMSQCYFNKKNIENWSCLYLSVDQIVQLLGMTLRDVLSVYEELIESSFEKLDKPLLLFLDEVQYDEKWGITLKSLYDRSNKVFIFATGSAALAMNNNPDIARRTIYEKLFPLSFSEYIKIKNHKQESNLCDEIEKALFESNSAKDVYNSLLNIENKISSYFLDIEKSEADKYIRYGSLPFMIALKNEALVYDQINKTLDRIINSDVAKTGRFKSEIISKIPAILYAVADMEKINYSKIAEIFEISRPKIMEIFDVLENTETLTRIFPYGSHLNQVRKPSKYLFSSPAFRSMYYNLIGNTISKENAKGKLVEDTVAMYISRKLYKMPNTSITYDSMEGGADFIVKIGNKKIIIEVGAGNKDWKQVVKTASRVKVSHSLVICNNDLEYSEFNNAVKIPFKYFLLI